MPLRWNRKRLGTKQATGYLPEPTTTIAFNTLRPTDAYMHQQTMACCLADAKPLAELTREYY